jgi:hypothetical protein
VTAVYKGSPKGASATLLRSYDSRKEPSPEFNCTIWQAGRATCATALAFKPIQIGQSMFLDEGTGKYNPAPRALDEAVCNEWPGREVGVFVSIGTGKRPKGTGAQQHLWWEGFVSSGMGDFAEARRRLIAKIEGCEETHQFMLKEHLAERQVNPENYYRFNVEVGVGEFGMNEWGRLAEISTNTRVYLGKDNVQGMSMDAASKLARIHRAKLRYERMQRGEAPQMSKFEEPFSMEPPPPLDPLAVELPAEPVDESQVHPAHRTHLAPSRANQRGSFSNEKYIISPEDYPLPPSASTTAVASPTSHHRPSMEYTSPYRRSHELYPGGQHSPEAPSPRRSGEDVNGPPPIPPKTPIQQPGVPSTHYRHHSGNPLPYPDTDGPPPVVNMARKPQWDGR